MRDMAKQKNNKEYLTKGQQRVPSAKYDCKKCGKSFTGKAYLDSHDCYPENKKFNS